MWFEGQGKVTAIRFSPASLSDRCEFEQRLRDYFRINFKVEFSMDLFYLFKDNEFVKNLKTVTPAPYQVRGKLQQESRTL